MRCSKILAFVAGAGLFGLSPVLAEDVKVDAGPAHVEVQQKSAPGVTYQNAEGNMATHDFADDATHSDTIIRASTLMGCTVFNNKYEVLGSVEDVVLNTETGELSYAAVSMGGFLGMGDELFAVPWRAFKCENREGKHVCVLAVSKERLSSAKGFNQDKWPNMADPKWQQLNDSVYEARARN